MIISEEGAGKKREEVKIMLAIIIIIRTSPAKANWLETLDSQWNVIP